MGTELSCAPEKEASAGRERWLTREAAARAIYFDFEGLKGEAPVLLGYTLGTRRRIKTHSLPVFQVVLDRTLRPCADQAAPVPVGDVTVSYSTLEKAVRMLVREAEAGDRLLVSWSTYDRDVVREYCSDQRLIERFCARHVNAIPTAKRWAGELGLEFEKDGAKRRNRLQHYMAVAHHCVPAELGSDVAATMIRRLRSALAAGHAPADFTPGMLSAWERLAGHNYHDLLGMRAVVMKAARLLEQAA